MTTNVSKFGVAINGQMMTWETLRLVAVVLEHNTDEKGELRTSGGTILTNGWFNAGAAEHWGDTRRMLSVIEVEARNAVDDTPVYYNREGMQTLKQFCLIPDFANDSTLDFDARTGCASGQTFGRWHGNRETFPQLAGLPLSSGYQTKSVVKAGLDARWKCPCGSDCGEDIE